MKRYLSTLFLLLLISCGISCNKKPYDPAQDPDKKKPAVEQPSDGGNQSEGEEDPSEGEETGDVVTAPPASLTQWLNYKESPLDPWYKKYVNCDGLPVLSSAAVSDEALLQACYIAREMLRKHPEAREEMIRCHFRIGVVGYKENITDLPECSVMPIWWPDTDWNERGRGYGATLALPVMSIGEENLIKIPNFQERYWSESIMVHEFAHNVDFAMRRVDSKFKKDLEEAFSKAKQEGLWKNTYSMENSEEYFAEGAQAWYDTCRMQVPKTGGTGTMKLKTREQLKEYDRRLYDICAYAFPEEKLKGYHFDYE